MRDEYIRKVLRLVRNFDGDSLWLRISTWGVQGRAKISLRDPGVLLADNGEGCIAVKRNFR